ncbi:MAG: hypothetical protein MJ240_01840 [Kiritimatiellae bacterium]|nr:hypothetical protein [Kiritimatiellia bacterium]
MATMATGVGIIGNQNGAIQYRDWDANSLACVNEGATGEIHTDAVYTALINAAQTMENRLAESLKTYQEHPDVQANLQQLQYDLQSWNLALTTMTNIQKNMGDALNSIASNFR